MAHNELQYPQEAAPVQDQLPYADYPPADSYGQWNFGPRGSGGPLPQQPDIGWGQPYQAENYGYSPYQPVNGYQEYAQQQPPTHEAQAVQPEQQTPAVVGRGRLAWQGVKRFFRFGRRNESADAAQPENTEVFEGQPQFSAEAEAFWNGEEQAVARAPRFLDQMQELRASRDSNLHSNVITAQPRDILEGHRSKFQFTEREGMEDLDGFLGQVIRTAYGKPDAASQRALESAMRMKEEFSFLDEQAFKQACDGIARQWKEYLEHDEGNVLNLYDHQRVGFDGKTEVKSYNIVLDKINERFTELIRDEPYLALRVKENPEQWVDAPGAKLVVVDDWISTGNTVRTNAQKAGAMADRMGLPGLAGKTEAHVLITRADQNIVEYGIGDDQTQVPVRSYYKTAHDSGAHRMSLSGAHSSVDYGFETPLTSMNEYLRSQHIIRDEPLLTHIQRDYQREAEVTPTQAELLQEIAALNAAEDHLSTELFALQGEMVSRPQYDRLLHDRATAALDSREVVHNRRQELVDQYNQQFGQ